MKKLTACCVYASLFLTACNLVEVTEKPTTEVPPVEETHPVRETGNVTYTGVVQPAGISIYQQGSHRLVLADGKFILLESDALDLNGYVNEEVQVFGALRPTVEAGGMIMRVEKITLQDTEDQEGSSEGSESMASSSEASEEAEVTEGTEGAEESSESSEGSESLASSNQSSEEAEVTERTEESLGSSSESSEEAEVTENAEESSSEASEESEMSYSSAYKENLEVMVKQDYAAENWTQSYCSSHVEFCIPVHRNFWFKSFGATGDALWHVEFSTAPIENLNEGPIALELIAGSNADNDGVVSVQNGKVVGYREWTFGRHFVIEADGELEAAVRYMTENISEFTE